MRLAGRILVVLGVASAPTVVSLFGCNVDVDHFSPLKDELPNTPGTPVTASASSSSSTSGTTASASSSSGAAGPAMSECDCAAAVLANSTPCITCQNTSCMAQFDGCVVGDCSAATACANTCCPNGCTSSSGPCLANCIDMYPDYGTYMSCLYLSCTTTCGFDPTITSCPVITDAGTD